jgi:hypothetical protein
MALTSPGVQVSIIDQSQFGAAGQGTVPLIILATQSNKDNVSSTGYASGTIPANANKPYLLTSQRELVELFGQPKFKTVNGTAVHGSELNEYGLFAAYSYLGLANRAYVLRADIDLLQLDPTDIEPAGAPANGTYWLDLANTSWGIFESSASGTGSWVSKTPIVITDSADTVGGVGVVPYPSIGVNGDYAVVATSTVSSYSVYKKVSGTWEICTTANSAIGTVFASPHYNIPTATAAGDLWLKTTNPNSGLSLPVKKYVSANMPDSSPWVIVATPSYVDDAAATTGFGSALSAGKVYVKVANASANIQLRYYDGSNWGTLDEEASASAPTGATVNGTLWYNTSLVADLYVKANGQWEPVSGDVTIDSNSPSSPATGDFWIDSSDVENYPAIYEFDGSSWTSRSVTDQTTPNGVVFADLTSTASDTTNGTGGATSIDENAPDPLLYPDDMLLWNSMVSTGNVKQYSNVLDASGVATGDKAWFTVSGNKENGSPYMLRKAQRRAVVKSLQSAVASNDTIREEMTFFTLIATPGYPELIDEMLSLNTDRKETAFVIVDTPMRLAPQGQTLINWMSGNNAASSGEDGLIVSGSAGYQAGCYYPSGLATDLSGNDVVVPASHIVLRTYAYNDQVAYPWFAPAGLTRGVVTNASNVGYINGEGEFIPVALTTGQRDTLYGDGSRIGLNPIARFPGQGLYIFGQKTLQTGSSALDRVNVSRLLAYLRERFDPLARPFIFEPNDIITRGNVKQVFDSFLGDLLAKRAIYDFIVVCDETNNTPARIDRNELYVDVAIEPVKAAEFIYIPVRVVNTGELS